jgi:hypothetical protein
MTRESGYRRSENDMRNSTTRPAMNSSLITADRTTHLKILAVSVLAALLVVWIGIGARLAGRESAAAVKPQVERSISKPLAPRSPVKAVPA